VATTSSNVSTFGQLCKRAESVVGLNTNLASIYHLGSERGAATTPARRVGLARPAPSTAKELPSARAGTGAEGAGVAPVGNDAPHALDDDDHFFGTEDDGDTPAALWGFVTAVHPTTADDDACLCLLVSDGLRSRCVLLRTPSEALRHLLALAWTHAVPSADGLRTWWEAWAISAAESEAPADARRKAWLASTASRRPAARLEALLAAEAATSDDRLLTPDERASLLHALQHDLDGLKLHVRRRAMLQLLCVLRAD